MIRASIKTHLGRPTIHVDGQPIPFIAYSPRGWDRRFFHEAVRRFAPHDLTIYFLCVPRLKDASYFDTPFWSGDDISDVPRGEPLLSLEEQAAHILAHSPNAYFIVRTGPVEPPSWRAIHPEELFVTDQGERLPHPSLASERFRDDACRFSRAVVQYCERQPWGNRLIGYWNGLRTEGTHDPVIEGWLFDHSEPMRRAWSEYRKRHGLPDAPIPTDLRKTQRGLYWTTDNQPLRHYLSLQKELFHRLFTGIAHATRDETVRLGRERVIVYDALKTTMAGWQLQDFFDPNQRDDNTPELLSGSGHMDVATLLDDPAFDGVLTPHDYQARGVGGVYEPEGCVDSCVLRGKLFVSEMDTRTWCGKDHYGRAENVKEFEAITWRNLATSLTRGFHSYWMDLHEDWFVDASIHDVIHGQASVLRASIDWRHEEVPGIAMVIDDAAILETDGRAQVLAETIQWELRQGLARCGVPYRVHLLQDLARDDFPAHRVIYFPCLHRIDPARLDLIRRVMNDGRVIVWGPGSGISEGLRIGTEAATRATGFEFDLINADYARRTLITEFDHPITRDLSPDTVIGSPTRYGPMLFPRDGTMLGRAWTKQGRNHAGLAIKSMPGWHSLFTTAAPLPAALWRGIARFAGAHVWCDSGDIVLADRSIVAVHSTKSGPRTLRLPRSCRVTELTGPLAWDATDAITCDISAPQTRIFLMQEPASRA